MIRRLLLCAAVLLAGAGAARAHAEGATSLDVTLDAGRRRVHGTVRIEIPNPTRAPLDRAYVWLYPNRFATRPAALDDVNFHWIYPNEFSAGQMRVLAARQGGRPVPAAAMGAAPHAAAGEGVLWVIDLPAPVAPGERLVLELEYAAIVPERYGGFGCVAGQCTLLGGFYPMLAALDEAGWDLAAPPQPTRFAGRMAFRSEMAAVVAGRLQRGSVASLAAEPASYLPVVVAPALHASERTRRGVRLVWVSTRPPPPADDAARQILPYSEEDYAAMGLGAAAQAVELLAEIGAPLPAGTELVMVEAPLRLDLALAHPRMVVASDRLFRLFPARRFRKFHGRELVRALYAEALGRRPPPAGVRAHEAPLVAELAADYLTDLYTVREYRKQEFARDVLSPVSFVPAIDQLIYAPQVAFAGAYFGAIADDDAFRDDVRRFNHDRPGGRLYYHKLQDLLDPKAFGEVMRKLVLGEAGVREAAEAVHGGSLSWFFRQWAGRYPKVNYKLAGRARERLPSGRWRHTVRVEKQRWDGAEGPVEPVEVRVVDGGGGKHLLRWDGRGARGEVAFESDSGSVDLVAVDPRYRLVEASAPGSPEDPRFDNRLPPRIKFIYNSFGALLNVTDQTLALAADFSFRRVHDNRHGVRLALFRSDAVPIGGSIGYSRYFGPKVIANRPAYGASVGLGVARLEFLGDPGTRLSISAGIGADDRRVIFEPMDARGWSVGARWSVTRFDETERQGGDLLKTVAAYGDATRIFTPIDGHTLVVNVEAAAVWGDIEARGQLISGGGPGGLRGYLPTEHFGRARVIAHGEWRGAWARDIDWNLGHWLWLRAAGMAVFADVGFLSSCDSPLDLISEDSFYASAGFGFRVFYDDLGVAQGMTALDFAIPLVFRPRECLGHPAQTAARPPFVVYLTFLPPF